MLKIAVDYDDTYTADPELWYDFMRTAQDRGHKVFICTYRDDRYDVDAELSYLEVQFEIVYTRGVAKKWWCEQFGPGEVDIWIDDKPERIYENSSMPVEKLVEWREGNMQKEYIEHG